jgi:hypothetical protein
MGPAGIILPSGVDTLRFTDNEALNSETPTADRHRCIHAVAVFVLGPISEGDIPDTAPELF